FLGQSLFATVLTLITISFNLMKPRIVAYLIDGVLLPADEKHAAAHAQIARWFGHSSVPTVIFALCLAFVLFHFLGGAHSGVTIAVFLWVGLRALPETRPELYASRQSLPLKFHDSRRAADSTFRVAYDSQAIQTTFNRGFTNIFQSAAALL